MEEGETINDRFFTMQRQAFERGDPPFFESGSTEEIEAFKILRASFLENAREYLSSVSEGAAEAVFDDLTSLAETSECVDMFCWASVHEGPSAHVPHTHPNSAVSGVFYVAAPPLAGEIVFEDPRAAWSPIFESNRRIHTPVAGKIRFASLVCAVLCRK